MATATREVKREVKQRQTDLHASGHSKAEVQRLSGVSERMVYFWYRGERASAKVARAHRALTGRGVDKTENGRRSAVNAATP